MTTSRLPRPARQPRPARRRAGRPAGVLAAATLALALAGCSDDGTAEDPGADASPEPGTSDASPTEPSASPSESPSATEPAAEPIEVPASGSAGVQQAWVVGATQAGGRVETLATPLDSDQAVADFAAQLDGADITAPLRQAVASAAVADQMTWGTVAAIGCDAPESVTVEAGEAGYEVTAELPAEEKQCVAPVTYVVVFTPTT